jgi:hypothetical protein
LPQLGIAFEVQDFSTHSVNSDTEEIHHFFQRHHPFKKGPVYHESKRGVALQEHGIVVYDLWEDDVLDGSFEVIVDRALGSVF